MEDTIEVGDYIVVQRQAYTKLHKLRENDHVILGKDSIELKNILSKRYHSIFQMNLKPNSKRVYTLTETTQISSVADQLTIEQSGSDNRGITDDGASQKLSTEDICKFRDEALTSSDIVEKLITNSTTFNSKTEYSQEKYLKKKEKKYFEYIKVLKPTIKILSEMFFRQDPAKVLGIRIDDLSQILTYSNVQSSGTFLIYESGTSGLPVAALLDRIGTNTNGKILHIHQGNEPQKQSIYAMKFEQEQLDRCLSVNLYSVLRWYYQKFKPNLATLNTNNVNSGSQISNEQHGEPEKAQENSETEKTETVTNNENSELQETSNGDEKNVRKRKLNDFQDESLQKSWQIDNERACRILENKVDSLIIIAKEHPVSIIEELVPFLNKSRPLVVFSVVLEVLQDLYFVLKKRSDFTALRLTENFVRNYQVLPNRTHPDVNMSHGGYILFGYKVDPELND